MVSNQLAFELLAFLVCLVGFAFFVAGFWPPIELSRLLLSAVFLYVGARMLQSTFPDEPYDPYE